jgi:hypothetical protein
MEDYRRGYMWGLHEKVRGEATKNKIKMYRKIKNDVNESLPEREFSKGYLDGYYNRKPY